MVDELCGRTKDGAALIDTLAKLKACCELLDREREATLFLAPSQSRAHEETEYLRSRIQQTQLQLAKARTQKKGLTRVDFTPGLAYNIDAPAPPQSMANLVQKLELVDTSLFYAVPKLQMPTLLNLSENVLRGLSAFVPHLQPEREVSAATAPLLSTLTLGIVRDARELAAGCTDKKERAAILSANEVFEEQADAFIAGVRKPTQSEIDRKSVITECLKASNSLASVITPKCLNDLLRQANPKSGHQQSFESSDQ